MRAIISRIISMFTGGGRRRRRSTTGGRRGLLSQAFSVVRSLFSGGRRRH